MVVGFIIASVAVVALLARKEHSSARTETDAERRRRERDEELITVILPTINNDK